MKHPSITFIAVFSAFGFLSACGGSSESSGSAGTIVSSLDRELRQLINDHDLTGDPVYSLGLSHKVPSIHSAKAQLGKKLFFSKILSGPQTVACASCHHPVLGGGDNLSMSIGVQALRPDVLGEDRQTVNNAVTDVARNVPTTFNTLFLQNVIFHDGRLHTVKSNGSVVGFHTPDVPFGQVDTLADKDILHAQNRFPVGSVEEMKGDFGVDMNNHELREALVSRIREGYDEAERAYWVEQFRLGYSDASSSPYDLITVDRTFDAISEYIRSQVFVNNAWSRYVKGNTSAISDQAKAGAKLFYTARARGGAGCSECHSGDYFTDEGFYNTGMPQVGIGKGSDVTESNDYGKAEFTKKPEDRFKFRALSLLNVEMTKPWGHDGAYTTLEGIVRHMLAPRKSALFYDRSQVTQSGAKLDQERANTLANINHSTLDIADMEYTDEMVEQLVAFLKALTDPCIKSRECLTPWIPAVGERDPMGLQLNAIDGAGRYY